MSRRTILKTHLLKPGSTEETWCGKTNAEYTKRGDEEGLRRALGVVLSKSFCARCVEAASKHYGMKG